MQFGRGHGHFLTIFLAQHRPLIVKLEWLVLSPPITAPLAGPKEALPGARNRAPHSCESGLDQWVQR